MKPYLNPGPDSPLGEKQASEANREVIYLWVAAGVPSLSHIVRVRPRFLPFSPTAEPGTRLKSGAPNGGFLPNALKTLFQTIQSTLRPLQIHSKRRYKISICSIFLGKLDTFFQKSKGFNIIFAKILNAIQRFAKKKIFLISLSVIF